MSKRMVPYQPQSYLPQQYGHPYTGQQQPQIVYVQAPPQPPAPRAKSIGMTTGSHVAWAIASFLTGGLAIPFWWLSAKHQKRAVRY